MKIKINNDVGSEIDKECISFIILMGYQSHKLIELPLHPPYVWKIIQDVLLLVGFIRRKILIEILLNWIFLLAFDIFLNHRCFLNHMLIFFLFKFEFCNAFLSFEFQNNVFCCRILYVKLFRWFDYRFSFLKNQSYQLFTNLI